MLPDNFNTEYNARDYHIRSLLSQISTATLVQVLKVNSITQMLEAQPLVRLGGSSGGSLVHAPLVDLPYIRYQGGKCAVICDPEPGDIGVVVFASRDITKVKATRGVSPPDTGRQFSMADGLYIGGCLNQAPEVVIRLNSDSGITITAPHINLDGQVRVRGSLTVTGDVQAAGVSVKNHRHISSQPGQLTSDAK